MCYQAREFGEQSPALVRCHSWRVATGCAAAKYTGSNVDEFYTRETILSFVELNTGGYIIADLKVFGKRYFGVIRDLNLKLLRNTRDGPHFATR